LIGRGEAWQSKGKVKRALADFKKALSIDPHNPDYQKLVDDLEEK
jgi:tetratricopeptide (TPR) repeat protein